VARLLSEGEPTYLAASADLRRRTSLSADLRPQGIAFAVATAEPGRLAQALTLLSALPLLSLVHELRGELQLPVGP